MSASQESEVLIIGAGVAGLTAAYLLREGGVEVMVIEARPRIGGRLLTVDAAGAPVPPEAADGQPWFDLGATWLWSNQPYVQRWLRTLGIATFPQYESGFALYEQGIGRTIERRPLPAKDRLSLRFAGGAQGLAHRLARDLPDDRLHLGTTARAVEVQGGHLVTTAKNADHDALPYRTRQVIVTLPPQLARDRLRFTPALPASLDAVMAATPTWMRISMKCVVTYEQPFWRARGLAGVAVSENGPVAAFHDATTEDDQHAALFGFFAPDPTVRVRTPGARRERVQFQLARLYGDDAARPDTYLELDWSHEPHTGLPGHTGIESDPPYGHPAFRQPLMNGCLHWAGTETAEEGGGYLEGALRSGERAAARILAGRR